MNKTMSKEEHNRIPLTAIHIDLRERSVRFDAESGPVGKLIVSGETILFEAHHASLPVGEQAPKLDDTPEREATVVVSGTLRSTPKAGRPDRSGNPTAWARLAVHEEDQPEAHLYLASFHRHSAQIALGLKPGASVTVAGYPHVSDDPKRLDTFSVMNIVNYPGKQARRT